MLGVWLDSPMINILHGPGTIEGKLPAMVRQFKRFDIDITQQPMLVYPTLHYQNGGVALEPDGAVAGIPNLYGAGEISGGVHGRNRLMGNSLLEITVFGRRAGRAAALRAREVELGRLNLSHADEWNRKLEEAGIEDPILSPILLPDYTRQVR
jgi:succinate dehydrogenase / fumarate reductase flavoprotein subunit